MARASPTPSIGPTVPRSGSATSTATLSGPSHLSPWNWKPVHSGQCSPGATRGSDMTATTARSSWSPAVTAAILPLSVSMPAPIRNAPATFRAATIPVTTVDSGGGGAGHCDAGIPPSQGPNIALSGSPAARWAARSSALLRASCTAASKIRKPSKPSGTSRSRSPWRGRESSSARASRLRHSAAHRPRAPASPGSAPPTRPKSSCRAAVAALGDPHSWRSAVEGAAIGPVARRWARPGRWITPHLSQNGYGQVGADPCGFRP
eukprot:9503896-Pyramimonas_sp.AAC.1